MTMDTDPEDVDMDLEDEKENVEKDISQDGGIIKIITQKGEGFDKPEKGDEVYVHYTGTLEDGTKFDSSRSRDQEFSFKLGMGNVIKGWDIGVATMKKGEKCILKCRSDYAYGDQGSPPTIPGGATLNFEVELIHWKSIKDILGDGGIIKKVVKEGEKFETPRDIDEVTVKYTVKSLEGNVLLKSEDTGETFSLDDDHQLCGMPDLAKTMKKGEVCSAQVKSPYALRASVGGLPAQSEVTVEAELVGWRAVKDVMGDKCVLKKILVEGSGWERPNEGSKVVLVGFARLSDGTVFEEFGEGSELKFTVDEEEVVLGVDKAVMEMKKGEKALITISHEYAFGDEDVVRASATVPGSSIVQYELELRDFELEKETWHLKTTEEKMEYALKYKQKGNDTFKQGKYERASKRYIKAVGYIEYDHDFSDEEKESAKQLKLTCHLNNAMCKLKLESFREALDASDKALSIDPNALKGLYRRALAHVGNADFDLAQADLKRCLEIDENNREVKTEMKKLRQKIAEQDAKDKKVFAKMFGQ